jgi:hypothetical protein
MSPCPASGPKARLNPAATQVMVTIAIVNTSMATMFSTLRRGSSPP